MTTDLLALIDQVATAYGLPRALVRAQVLVESEGDPFACRYESAFFDRYIRLNASAAAKKYGPFAACSVGLLQVLVEVAYEMGFTGRPEDLFEPRVALNFGCRKMRDLWLAAGNTTPDYRVALAAYNGGPRWIHQAEATWPKDVQAYVDAVYQQVRTDG